MSFDRAEIRKLTTAAEFALVQASSAAAIKSLSRRELRANLSRTRRLRDKQRDLDRRQRLSRRARTGSKHGGTGRTAQKARLFDETLARFEKRLHKLLEKPQAAIRAQRRPQAGKRPKPRSGGAVKARGQTALLPKARTPRMKAMQAHVSSRGRRAQARRDSR